VHGRSFKPDKVDLWKLWKGAVRAGIKRDYPPSKLRAFDDAKTEMIYYGNYSNQFLRSKGQSYNKVADVRDRQKTLESLKVYDANQFTKSTYKKLPGKASYKEFIADVLGGPVGAIGLGEELTSFAAPDMAHYWNPDTQYGSDVRYPMINPLRRAMDRGDRIMVVSHSLGTMISYDTFWKFAHMAEYRDKYSRKKIDRWITLGSPLADETAKRHLRGAQVRGRRKYPNNVVDWFNVAAEDDYISHDSKVRNDYKEMFKYGLIRKIEDYMIYNLSVRDGDSNPHSGIGYLIHPTVVNLICKWL